MARSIKAILRLSLPLLLVASITTNNPQIILPEGMPDIGFPIGQLAGNVIGIHLVPFENLNTHKTRDQIILAIYSKTMEPVRLGNTYFRGFQYDHGKWIELKGLHVKHSLDGGSLDNLHSAFPVITVELPDPNQYAVVRIFLIAEIIDINGVKQDKKAVAFVDAHLWP